VLGIVASLVVLHFGLCLSGLHDHVRHEVAVQHHGADHHGDSECSGLGFLELDRPASGAPVYGQRVDAAAVVTGKSDAFVLARLPVRSAVSAVTLTAMCVSRT
jgi:hypothetical protein